MVCTFFEAFNVPVFWPILVMYFVMLFCITMKRQIKVRAPRPHGERRGRQGQWQRGWPGLRPVTREGDAEPASSTRGSRQLCAGLGREHGAPLPCTKASQHGTAPQLGAWGRALGWHREGPWLCPLPGQSGPAGRGCSPEQAWADRPAQPRGAPHPGACPVGWGARCWGPGLVTRREDVAHRKAVLNFVCLSPAHDKVPVHPLHARQEDVQGEGGCGQDVRKLDAAGASLPRSLRRV